MKKAFSLVELSIVLVILGLLVGGVLSGQALIHAAELRKAMRDAQSYRTAIFAFREKYSALPGDMKNAQSYWPACVDDAGSSACNGNGDTLISTAGALNNEPYRVFEHLSLAGLISGSYDGVVSTPTPMRPPRVLLGTPWIQYSSDGSFYADNKTGNVILFNTSDGEPSKPEDVWNFDKKTDDGNGLQGELRIMYDEMPSPGGCMDTATGEYAMDGITDYCHIYIFFE